MIFMSLIGQDLRKAVCEAIALALLIVFGVSALGAVVFYLVRTYWH